MPVKDSLSALLSRIKAFRRFDESPKRIVIIGNSGSGKSFLSKKIGTSNSLPVVHLDDLFFVPGNFNKNRNPKIVRSEIKSKKKEKEWVVEGIFGDLAELFLDRAHYLIWLDLPWPLCREGLLARGPQISNYLDPVNAEENYRNLFIWAERYWSRTDSRSHFRHQKIFDGFHGPKDRFNDRESVEALSLGAVPTSPVEISDR